MKRVRIALAVLLVTCGLTLSFIYVRMLLTPDLRLTDDRVGPSSEPDIDVEQYLAFSAVLEHSYVEGGRKLLVFQSETSKDESEQRKTSEFAEILRSLAAEDSILAKDTIDDFVSRNGNPELVRDLFTLSVKHTFVTPEEVSSYFGEGGGWWEAFYRDYPLSSGLIRLSRVGFNQRNDQALVYVEHGCGGQCGTGKYFSLKKDAGAWTVVHEYMRWIS